MDQILQWKTHCDVIKSIWNILVTTNGEEIEHTRLVKQLAKTLSLSGNELAEQHVATALEDGLLVENTRVKQRGKQKSSTVYALPKWETFAYAAQQPDLYCYECHTNTGGIIKCDGCLRSFHGSCIKSLEEKHLELEQFVSKQKRITVSSFRPRASTILSRQSTTSPAITEESNISSGDALASNNGISARLNSQDGTSSQDDDDVEVVEISLNRDAPMDETPASMVKHETDFEQTNGSVKQEDDIKEGIVQTDEAMFVCMVRPPDRRLERSLNTPSIKPEETANSDGTDSDVHGDTIMKKYCYACRLLMDSLNNAQPNVGKRELNYLLNFIIEEYKSWIPEDTFSVNKLHKGKPLQTLVLERKTIDVCKKMLLRNPKSIFDIRTAIAEERYNTLDEFHIDLEDVAHNVAIIHGVISLDYSAVMYFLADCVYDLFEIRRCSDCYRHSNEKAEPDWFARPCRTRHELVFAKQKSYQYWPAKVIRVLNNKYDVRFFGDKHLRAIVEANFVKPIDTELRTLKVNDKHRGFRLAMEEMLKHQSLIDGYREHFTFGSNNLELPPIVNAIESNTLRTELVASGRASGANRRKRSNPNQQRDTMNHSFPHNELSVHPTPLESEKSSSGTSSKMSRAKRRKSMPQIEISVKKTRSSNQPTTYSNSLSQSSTPVAKKATQQNNNTIDGDYNMLSGNSSTATYSARLPRTKQNQMMLSPQHNDSFRLKKLFHQVSDPNELKDVALKILQENEERFARRLEWLKETHKRQLSEVKKKQWCAVCELEANVWCCWNTYYCSTICQAQHYSEHQHQHQPACAGELGYPMHGNP